MLSVGTDQRVCHQLSPLRAPTREGRNPAGRDHLTPAGNRKKIEKLGSVIVRKQFTFEAAHWLPHHLGKCSRMHGHSYRVEVSLSGGLEANGPSSGMVMDFDDLETIVEATVIRHLDHTLLNDKITNPTVELTARWIWEHLAERLPTLFQITVWETATACAVASQFDH